MSEKANLAYMTGPSLREYGGPTVALLPVGATEQHGVNLTLGTDSIAAERIAERIAERYGPGAVVLPTLPYGFSEHHMAFAGTVSISPESMLGVIRDIARSLARQGSRMLVLVNGHNGNTATLNVAAATIRYETGLKTAVMFYFKQASDVVKKYGQTERYGHACEIETSVMLHLAPEAVGKGELQPGELIPHHRQHADNMDPFSLYVPVPFDQQTRNGVFGNASLATAEVGEEIVEAAVERTVVTLRSLLDETADDA